MAGVDPAGLDVTTPNIARMYDYMLDGKDNFAADRDATEKLITMMPRLPLIARANRAFLRRAVQVLVTEYGIRQFIDVGTGLPTMGNVHEVARRAAPDTRVLYVDNDPVVCCHARALLSSAATQIIEADLRRPDEILGHPLTRQTIDAPVRAEWMRVVLRSVQVVPVRVQVSRNIVPGRLPPNRTSSFLGG